MEGTTTTEPRRRAAHLGPERRRPLVLDAAFALFLERGYSGTSMEAIAQAAGVTKPVVYACYPSKDELFKALLEREEARVLRQVADALPAAADLDDPEGTLIEAFTAFLRAVAASPDAYRVVFLGEGGVDRAVARRVQRGREMQIDAIAALARSWIENSGSDGDAEAASRLIGHLIVGLGEAGARALLSDPERWTPEDLGRSLGRFAARGQSVL
jgi:AcrR family transcriptional regulator